jgi:PPOX class probable F420-dependent enzyme
MAHALPDKLIQWIDSAEFAVIGTIEPDGRPQLSVVWLAYDGGDLLVSTVVGRRKHRNLVADPRCTVIVYPRDKPYEYAEVRGTSTMTEQGGRELIDALAAKYRGLDRYPFDDGTGNVRVVVRITPDKVVVR